MKFEIDKENKKNKSNQTFSMVLIDQLKRFDFSNKKVESALGIDTTQRQGIFHRNRKITLQEFFSLLLFLKRRADKEKIDWPSITDAMLIVFEDQFDNSKEEKF